MDLIVIPYFISRKFIQEHRELFFVYGWDAQGKSTFGQCWQAHGEENSSPIYTMRKMCKSSSYFIDSMFPVDVRNFIDTCIANIKTRSAQRPIILFRNIGKGCSRMFELAPNSYKYMVDELNKIKYPNVKIDYTQLGY